MWACDFHVLTDKHPDYFYSAGPFSYDEFIDTQKREILD